MVGGYHQEVIRLHRSKELGQPEIEFLERRGISGHVAAVAVLGVEVEEIHELESAVAKPSEPFERPVEHG